MSATLTPIPSAEHGTPAHSPDHTWRWVVVAAATGSTAALVTAAVLASTLTLNLPLA
ncbi:MAG TPA: hypothetical protein VEV13_06635 [Candidatus Limnocylindria bacterium]|nr:hypothetical protein [Candidatus Limnocylindria bacterium]